MQQCVDEARRGVRRPGKPETEADDDLAMQFVVEGEDPMVAFFRCSEPTIGQSIESQFRDLAARGPSPRAFNAGGADRRSRELLGLPYRDAIEHVMALTLYLNS